LELDVDVAPAEAVEVLDEEGAVAGDVHADHRAGTEIKPRAPAKDLR